MVLNIGTNFVYIFPFFQSFTIFQDDASSNTTSGKHASGRPNIINDENQPPAGQKPSCKFPPPPSIPLATSSPGKTLFINYLIKRLAVKKRSKGSVC